MTKAQKFVPIAVLGILLLIVGYGLIPFKVAGAVDCEAPLLGAKPAAGAEPVGFIQPERDCLRRAKTKLSTAAIFAVIAVAGGTAAIAFKPISSSCLNGNHDDCPQWWGNLMTQGSGLGCQCECH